MIDPNKPSIDLGIIADELNENRVFKARTGVHQTKTNDDYTDYDDDDTDWNTEELLSFLRRIDPTIERDIASFRQLIYSRADGQLPSKWD